MTCTRIPWSRAALCTVPTGLPSVGQTDSFLGLTPKSSGLVSLAKRLPKAILGVLLGPQICSRLMVDNISNDNNNSSNNNRNTTNTKSNNYLASMCGLDTWRGPS